MTEFEKAEQIVYISCVHEVRYSFVSHLSEALLRKGINDVFVDSDDLLSEEALAKMERARVFVMVLPGNQEPTTACLSKLVKVLERQGNNDQVVIPVLYGVKTLEGEWRRVLQNLSGLSLTHQSRKECTDSNLVNEIVRDVYEKLFCMGRIGIYSKLLEIENMVRKQPRGIRCVGIWGMPGVGKTTLAEAVFDQMSASFDACCFIKDYERVIHEKGLYRLLAEQFLKEQPGPGGTFTILRLLRDKLNNKRVLVVLDDVRNPLVLESFLGRFDWFAPKSVIIITSRDKQVFRLCRINQIYEVQGLRENEALQLFYLSASLKDMAEQNLHELSMRVIDYTNGNPLALNIFGRELKGKKKLSEMETAFLKLKRRPPCKIVDSFKRSYDTLSASEKNIFLDIASFFLGENVDYVMQMLDGCGFFPHVGINVLVEKCLVSILENRVQMHNLTQVVALELINGETVQIERRSRLWEPGIIKYLLEDNEHRANGEPNTAFKRAQGSEEIEGLFLDTSNLSFDLKPAAFKNMLNLRFLKIYCSDPEIHTVIKFSKNFLHSLPNELRLLHWENYPLQSLPQDFDPMHLVEINMPYSQLEKLWGGTKTMEMLKTIRLSHSTHLVDIDDLLKAPKLEVIDLRGCTKLQSCPSTGQLLHLRDVNLSGCKEIESLPEVPPNIETLHLQGTGIRKLPLSIYKPNGGELVNLRTEFPHLSDALKLKRLGSLVESSPTSQVLRKLTCLELKDCSRLRKLPNMINLELVKVLDLSGCSRLKSIKGFPQNLKELYLAGTAVRKVRKLPRSLETLNAHGCLSLNSIHWKFEQLPMHYTFSNCFDLSPQMVNNFLVKTLAIVKHIPKEHPQELDKDLAFSFCAPSHSNQDSELGLQPGSSVMIHLTSSWRSTLVGFAMLVKVAFSEDYYDAGGFCISCVCRWKDKEGQSHRIERNLHCWAPRKALPKVQRDHMFVFCDVNMRPRTNEGNDPNIWADLVVFEFYPVNKQTRRLDDSCTVTRCGVHAITAANGNTGLENNSPVLSLDPREFTGNEFEDELRASYDGLEEIYKALFLCILGLFDNGYADLVKPHCFSSTDENISSGLKVLANRSLIHISSNGEIVMNCLQRQMCKDILYRPSMLPCSSKGLIRDFETVSMAPHLSRSWKYDVFPSFSREDVSKYFLSHLFGALERKLFITFKDDEIERSQPINLHLANAIRESRILIVVFTKNYASSSYLLNELVEISQSKTESGQPVVPIFYDVSRSNVRNQGGVFGQKFKWTCWNKTKDEKQRWCRALTDIGSLAGYSYNNWDNEGAIIEAIAKDVFKKLNLTASKDIDNFVGIEEHILKLSSSLCFESELVRMVGIWGPSGIGKSTIARALYSQVARQFQASIFVDRTFADKIMENSRGAKLGYYETMLCLQREFLSKILDRKYIEVNHLGMVRERLKHHKALIILDDVDDQILLDALVGKTQWFGSGSRIIVITQDAGLLTSHGIVDVYKVDLPSKKQALQMFCLSAFRQNYPPNGFEDLAVEVVEAVGSVPLGLKVFGSSLRGRDKLEWKAILTQTGNSLHGELEKIFRVVYDRLYDHDKVIFVHIACLFNGNTVEFVKRLLADCDLNWKIGLTSLAEKSVIHITENGEIKMYNLQQKLGREIICNESIQEPGRRRFLVSSWDICDVLVNNTGTDNILGISLDMSEMDKLSISERGFNKMRNLWFLKFYTNLGNKEVKVHLPHGLDYLPPKLRLLHWEAFPMRCMPSIFSPEHLVELVMEASKLETLWSGVQPLGRLKFMSLRGSLDLKEIPDLSYATSLESLDFGGCASLIMLPSSIRNLHKLRDLDMEGCIQLRVLPFGINLESLYCLNLKGCSQLRRFPEISRNISYLYLDGTAIEEVPWRIEDISRLSYLSMNSCNKLENISPNISKLKLLVEVDFSNCKALTENSWMNHPTEISSSLMIVNMSGNSFKRLPGACTSIQPKDFVFDNCRNLLSLPELPASLSRLTANNCESLVHVCGSFHYPHSLQFINCFTLNFEAREYILLSDCVYAILPGGKLPLFFTHRDRGSSLILSLPRSYPSKKYPTFKACIVVEFRSGWFYFGVTHRSSDGRNHKKYISCLTNTTSRRSHLILFNCEFSPDEVNDYPGKLGIINLRFEFFCHDHRMEPIEIKECGIELLDVLPSASHSDRRYEIEYSNDTGDSSAEETSSSNGSGEGSAQKSRRKKRRRMR